MVVHHEVLLNLESFFGHNERILVFDRDDPTTVGGENNDRRRLRVPMNLDEVLHHEFCCPFHVSPSVSRGLAEPAPENVDRGFTIAARPLRIEDALVQVGSGANQPEGFDHVG